MHNKFIKIFQLIAFLGTMASGITCEPPKSSAQDTRRSVAFRGGDPALASALADVIAVDEVRRRLIADTRETAPCAKDGRGSVVALGSADQEGKCVYTSSLDYLISGELNHYSIQCLTLMGTTSPGEGKRIINNFVLGEARDRLKFSLKNIDVKDKEVRLAIRPILRKHVTPASGFLALQHPWWLP